MALWLVLLWAGSFLLGQILRPKQKIDGPKPSSLGDFKLPTAEEGRPIPWLLGTCKVTGGNVLWYGDLENRPIKQKTGGLFSKKVLVGYKIFLGEQIGLCMGPVDQIVEVRFDDKPVTGGALFVALGQNTIVFANTPPPYLEADVPPGGYATTTELSVATDTAMGDADPGTWKLCFGFHLIPGRSSELVYSVYGDFGSGDEATDITLDVGGVYLSGLDAARNLTYAMNSKERAQDGGARVEWSVDYDDSTGHILFGFTALRGTVHGCYIRGIVDYSVSALGNLGFQMGVDHFTAGTVGTIEGGFEVRDDRFTFAFGGTGGVLNLEDPDFTAQETYGLPHFGTPTMPVLAGAGRGVPGFASYHELSDDLVRIVVNAPDLFGGEKGDGGWVGTIDFYKGTTTQMPNDYLEGVLGTKLPAYRRLCYAVFRHAYQGNSPYLKDPAFVVRRSSSAVVAASLGWDAGLGDLDGDANPAAGLYELCTDPIYLAAIPTGLIDDASFLACAETLAEESLGISMLNDSQAPAGDLAEELLRHVDGCLYVDPFTGKVVMALARFDYEPGTLLNVDEDVYLREDPDDPSSPSTLEISRPDLEDTRNVVRARFIDRSSNYTERTAQEQNLANIARRGGIRDAEEVDFHGYSNAVNAQRGASRLLKTLSYPLRGATFKANRRTSRLRPNGVFALSSVRYTMTRVPFRVTRIEIGDPRAETIIITAVEDVFGIDHPSYTPPVGGWTNPGVTPQALAAERIEEIPYVTLGAADRRVMTLGAVGINPVDGYDVWSDPLGGMAYTKTQEVRRLTPFGALVGEVAPGDDAIELSGADVALLQSVSADQFRAGTNLLLVDDEWIAWQDIVDNANGTFTISTLGRGCLDSTPKRHGAGADVWFVSSGSGLTQDDPYAGDGTIAVKLRTVRGAEQAFLSGIRRLSLSLASRALRPSCPAKVTVNGESYPTTLPSSGDVQLDWFHRDRTDTSDDSYGDSNATPALESGTHYRLRIYGEDGTLLHTEEPLTGRTFIYTNATERSENDGDLSARLRFVLDSVQDAGDELESRQAFDWTLARGSLAPPAALNPTGRILLQPDDFIGDGSTTARGTAGEILPVRDLPQVSDRTEVASFIVPDDFTALVSISLLYCNTDTSTNHWTSRVGLRVVSNGVDGTDEPTWSATEEVAPPATQDLIAEIGYGPPDVALAAGDVVLLSLQRKPGGDAGDTNTHDMAIVGVRLAYG